MYKQDQSIRTINRFFGPEPDAVMEKQINLALFFIKQHLPYSCAGKRLQSLLTALGVGSETRITPPTMSNTYLPAIYHAIDSKLIEILRGVSFISLTYDGWTDRTNRKFLVATVHFISPDWIQRRALIRAKHITESTTIPVVERFVKTLMKSKLQKDILLGCITTDGAKNMMGSAHRISGDTIWCVCHRLHLLITDSIDQDPKARKVVDNIRSFSRAVRVSTELTQAFRSQQNSQKPKSLCLDMPTRWNSIFRMISKFSVYQTILDLAEKQEFAPLIQFVPVLLDVVQLKRILEPFDFMTTFFQGDGIIAEVLPRLLSIETMSSTTFPDISQQNQRKFCYAFF